MHAKTELCSSSEAYCLTVYAFVVDSSVIYEPFFVVPRTTNYVRCLQSMYANYEHKFQPICSYKEKSTVVIL